MLTIPLKQWILALLLLGLLGVGGVILWQGNVELSEAQKVDQTQIALQKAVSKAKAVLKLPVGDIDVENILNAARQDFPEAVTVDPELILHLEHSARSAHFELTPEGDVHLERLENFTRFGIRSGRIYRNNTINP